MNGAESILTPNVVLGVNPQDNTGGLRVKTDEKTEQAAKDFESVLMSQLVNAMKETVGAVADDEEQAGEGQVKGLFWLYLARDVGDKGGLGLWKDLYRFFSDIQKPDIATQSLDENL